MGANRIHVEQKVKDCGNGWCNDPEPCPGHTMKYNYNSVVDISTIELDGQTISGDDDLLLQLIEMINNANADRLERTS